MAATVAPVTRAPVQVNPRRWLDSESSEARLRSRFAGPVWDSMASAAGDMLTILDVLTAEACGEECWNRDGCVAFAFSPLASLTHPSSGLQSCRLLSARRPWRGQQDYDFKIYVRRVPGFSFNKECLMEGWKPVEGKDPEASSSLDAWIDQELPKMPKFRMDPLDAILEIPGLVDKDAGLFMEFGVFQGNTANQIASFLPSDKRMYGFDSFIGLPEDWHIGVQGVGDPRARTIHKEVFSLYGMLPEVRPNVELVQGWFNETLPRFLEREVMKKKGAFISLLHIDCDLYSSTKIVFDA